MRRRVTITTHWSLGFMLTLLTSEADWPWLYWLFGLNAFVMVALALFGGLMSRPSPSLTGFPRAIHPWMHRLLYALLTWVGAITIYAQVTDGLTERQLFNWYLILYAAAIPHAIFHLWRHTALNDGALRRITPKFIHKIL